MDRVMLYRRNQTQEEIISPNKNLPGLKQRVFDSSLFSHRLLNYVNKLVLLNVLTVIKPSKS